MPQASWYVVGLLRVPHMDAHHALGSCLSAGGQLCILPCGALHALVLCAPCLVQCPVVVSVSETMLSEVVCPVLEVSSMSLRGLWSWPGFVETKQDAPGLNKPPGPQAPTPSFVPSGATALLGAAHLPLNRMILQPRPSSLFMSKWIFMFSF